MNSLVISSFFRVALIGAMVGCSGETAERPAVRQASCGWNDTVRLRPQGIGALRIGMSTVDLMRQCTVIRDTTELLEGQPQRFVYVRVGPAVAYVEIVQDSVWRIGTNDARLRTVDGLGVGTLLHTLLASDPEWAAHGERGVAVGLRSHCRLSFLLTPMFQAPDRPLVVRQLADLRKASPSTQVAEVLIVGSAHCDERATG